MEKLSATAEYAFYSFCVTLNRCFNAYGLLALVLAKSPSPFFDSSLYLALCCLQRIKWNFSGHLHK
jgi:hypothetical protein